SSLCAQVHESAAAVNGSVLDANGKPVAAGVSVELQTSNQTVTTTTDSAGIYHFSATAGLSYTLRARLNATSDATFGPFVLAPNETKSVNLKPADLPAFFDQPTFIVAGVTASSNSGGHGSDTVLRSSEALAKATRSLRSESTANAPGASAQSLRET